MSIYIWPVHKYVAKVTCELETEVTLIRTIDIDIFGNFYSLGSMSQSNALAGLHAICHAIQYLLSQVVPAWDSQGHSQEF